MLVDICMKLEEFLSYRAERIETQFGDGQSSKGNNSKSIMKVMVLALCTSSNAG